MRALELGSFAMVMASGIVSVHMLGRAVSWVSAALLWIAVGGYVVLVVRTGRRLAGGADTLRAELSDPARAFGSFAFVAATGVLGVRVALAGDLSAALVALAVAGAALLALGVVVPRGVMRGRGTDPAVADGNWFLCAVGCQSVAVLAATTEPTTDGGALVLTPLAIAAWLAGAVLYVVMLARIVVRLRRHGMRPAELRPPYWVTMGVARHHGARRCPDRRHA